MIRVIIIDDVDVVRAGITAALHQADDIELLGEAADGKKGIALVQQKKPDVALVDFHMPPGLDGFELIKRIQRACEHTKIIIITSDTDLHRLSRTIKMGVKGIIFKNDRELITKSIRAVIQGRGYLQPEMAYDLLVSSESEHNLKDLNQTQYKIFIKTAEGKKPQQISKEINLSPRTVSNELIKIKKKLNIKTTAELIRLGTNHLPKL